MRTACGGGRLVFRLRPLVERLVCSVCGSCEVVRRGTVERELRTVPIGRKPVFLALPVQRLACRHCQALRQARRGFADPRKHSSRSFERYVLDLLRDATIKTVAQPLGVSWEVVKDLQKRHLSRRFGRPKLKRLRCLRLDELSLGKGNRSLTLVVEWVTGAVVFVGDGRGGDALLPFWKRLRASHAQVEAVAMDRSPAYYLKEDRRRFWDQPDKVRAQALLEDWIARAQCSGIQRLQKFANTLAGHRTGLLPYSDVPLSTGPLEGLNNKSRTGHRQAYGFRDHEFLKLRIYGLHETKYALVG